MAICAASRFGMSLCLHHALAFQTQLHTRRRMDGVVYAAMQGNEAAEHPVVGGICDGIHTQAGDVALPKAQVRMARTRGNVIQSHHSFLCQLFLQFLVLRSHELGADSVRRTYIQQGTHQSLPLLQADRHFHRTVFLPLVEQRAQYAARRNALCRPCVRRCFPPSPTAPRADSPVTGDRFPCGALWQNIVRFRPVS